MENKIVLKFKKAAAAGLAAALLTFGAACSVAPPKDNSAIIRVAENGKAKVSSDNLSTINEEKRVALENAVSKLLLDDAYYGKYNPYNVTNLKVKYFSVAPYKQAAPDVDYVYGDYGYEMFGAPTDEGSQEDLSKVTMTVDLTINTNGKESTEETTIEYVVPSTELAEALESGEVSSNEIVGLVTTATEEKMEEMDNGAGEYEEDNAIVASPIAHPNLEIAQYVEQHLEEFLLKNSRYVDLVNQGFELKTISVGYLGNSPGAAYSSYEDEDVPMWAEKKSETIYPFECFKSDGYCMVRHMHNGNQHDQFQIVIPFYTLAANPLTGEKLLLGDEYFYYYEYFTDEAKNWFDSAENNWSALDINSLFAYFVQNENLFFGTQEDSLYRATVNAYGYENKDALERVIKLDTGLVYKEDLNTTTDLELIKMAYIIENGLTDANVIVTNQEKLNSYQNTK